MLFFHFSFFYFLDFSFFAPRFLPSPHTKYDSLFFFSSPIPSPLKKKKKELRLSQSLLLFPARSSLPSPDLPSFLLLHSSISPSLSSPTLFSCIHFFFFSYSPQIVISRFSCYTPFLGLNILLPPLVLSIIQLSHISFRAILIQGVFCPAPCR